MSTKEDYQWQRVGSELHLRATVMSGFASLEHHARRSLREFSRTALKEQIRDYVQWNQEMHWTDFAKPIYHLDMSVYPFHVTAEINEDMIKRWKAKATAENKASGRITYLG